MAHKLVDATELREGSYVKIDNAPCIVRRIDISKTGKHGASKARIEAVGVMDGKKRVIAVPGHERLEVPLIEKKKGQIMSFNEKQANIMDIESYETMDVAISEDLIGQLSEGMQVEYWEIEGQKIIKRKL